MLGNFVCFLPIQRQHFVCRQFKNINGFDMTNLDRVLVGLSFLANLCQHYHHCHHHHFLTDTKTTVEKAENRQASIGLNLCSVLMNIKWQ